MRRRTILLVAGLSFSLMCLTPHTASADSQKISMTPGAVNEVVLPGSATKGSFEVSDLGQTNFTFHTYVSPYSVIGENYTPDFTPLPGRQNAASWLQLSVAQATLQPNQSATIYYTLSVPKATLPGGYYGVAFAQTQLPSATSRGVIVNERVGCIFYVHVAGPAKQAGSVLSWQTAFLQKPPLQATLRLEDSGSVHYTSHITLTVRDIFGTPKYSYQTEKIILPQTIRRVIITSSSLPGFALLKVNGTATVIGQTKLLPTKYVLIMSKTTRTTLLVIVIVLCIMLVLRLGLRVRRGLRHTKAVRYTRRS
jgi:hypothetical protein